MIIKMLITDKAIKIDNDGGLIISKGKKTNRVLVGDVKEWLVDIF